MAEHNEFIARGFEGPPIPPPNRESEVGWGFGAVWLETKESKARGRRYQEYLDAYGEYHAERRSRTA